LGFGFLHFRTSLPARVDRNLHYPQDLSGQVHQDGQIWSRALWDIRNALGHVVADTVIMNTQFFFAPDSTMLHTAQATVDTAQNRHGSSWVDTVEASFQARGIMP
jgi:hypothetical protein